VKASFHINIIPIIAGLIMIPSIIYAETAPSTSQITPIEHPTICERTCGAKHAFVVKVKDQVSAIVNKIKTKIAGNGGNFEGNTEHGCFDGRSALGAIKGEYISISKNEIEIVITDKPFIVPYKMIECRVREFLN
jgi:hypothetical protein